MTTMQLPIVSTCSATGCSYNHDTDCQAGAITVTDAACGTFVETGDKGGTDSTAAVGACHRTDCVFNASLECTAKDIAMVADGDVATCQTYQAA